MQDSELHADADQNHEDVIEPESECGPFLLGVAPSYRHKLQEALLLVQNLDRVLKSVIMLAIIKIIQVVDRSHV